MIPQVPFTKLKKKGPKVENKITAVKDAAGINLDKAGCPPSQLL